MKKKKIEFDESGIVIDAFKEGDYPQGIFKAKELSEIAGTYNPTNYEAPVLIGHLSDPIYKGKTTIPAFGWIGKVVQVGDHLKFITSQFSEQLKQFIKEGLYKKVSAAFFDPSDPSNPTPGKWHLHHLAFLGAVPPQVKGLEGIAFSIQGSQGIEFAEVPAVVSENGSVIDTVEKIGTEDTIKDLTESCATFISKITDALSNDIDEDTQKVRCFLSLSDLQSEMYDCISGHFDFTDKLENIEEHKEAEMSEKKNKLLEFAKSLFTNNNRKESIDMEKEQEEKYQKQISDLTAQVKEFSDEKTAADLKAKQAEEIATDEKLLVQVKEFCVKEKLTTKLHQDMHIQDILFAVARSNSTVEFAGKDKDGKDVMVKTPVLDILKNALKSFHITTPPEGELAAEFAEDTKKADTEAVSEYMKKVDAYIAKHPTEFANMTTVQARAEVIVKSDDHKIKL